MKLIRVVTANKCKIKSYCVGPLCCGTPLRATLQNIITFRSIFESIIFVKRELNRCVVHSDIHFKSASIIQHPFLLQKAQKKWSITISYTRPVPIMLNDRVNVHCLLWIKFRLPGQAFCSMTQSLGIASIR